MDLFIIIIEIWDLLLWPRDHFTFITHSVFPQAEGPYLSLHLMLGVTIQTTCALHLRQPDSGSGDL